MEQTEGEELQADGGVVEQPVGEWVEFIVPGTVVQVEGEEDGPAASPEQAQGEEGALITGPLLPVVQQQPEMPIDVEEEQQAEPRDGRGEPQHHGPGDISVRHGVMFPPCPSHSLLPKPPTL